jgi:hypothetical protein
MLYRPRAHDEISVVVMPIMARPHVRTAPGFKGRARSSCRDVFLGHGHRDQREHRPNDPEARGAPMPYGPHALWPSATQRTRLADHLTYSQKRRHPQGEERTRACRASAYEGVPQPPTCAVHLARPAGPPAAGALLSCKPEHKRKAVTAIVESPRSQRWLLPPQRTSQKSPPHTPTPSRG